MGGDRGSAVQPAHRSAPQDAGLREAAGGAAGGASGDGGGEGPGGDPPGPRRRGRRAGRHRSAAAPGGFLAGQPGGQGKGRAGAGPGRRGRRAGHGRSAAMAGGRAAGDAGHHHADGGQPGAVRQLRGDPRADPRADSGGAADRAHHRVSGPGGVLSQLRRRVGQAGAAATGPGVHQGRARDRPPGHREGAGGGRLARIAVDHGEFTLDEQLAALLKGE